LYICSPLFEEKNNAQIDQSTITNLRTPEATAKTTCTNTLLNETTIGKSYDILLQNSNNPRSNSVRRACERDFTVRLECLFVVDMVVVVVMVYCNSQTVLPVREIYGRLWLQRIRLCFWLQQKARKQKQKQQQQQQRQQSNRVAWPRN